MDNFIVSARKYRPSTFDSVIGQVSITSTLKNAIRNNHLSHAYLFCGPRGVGKTTCARIFAKTINCQHLTPELEPCEKCESCVSFSESRSYNIHELDAASNNSVDDIRNLIDQVRIPPQIGKYSVYIIDEVHMLSAQAFNAFLKTLEEPPHHAVFILATTEKHKIIPTILSRCQIFDFNRIKVNDTVQYLEYIAKKEKIEYEVDAFNVIAQKADGAMRDALSIFDQIVSFSGSSITYKSVIENLNILDYDYYFKLVDAFLANQVSDVLMILDDILDNGFDLQNFIVGLSSHLRDLLVCKDEVTLQLLEVGANIAQRYKEQTSRCSVQFIFKALNLCSSCELNFKSSRSPRLHVELSLIQLCNINGLPVEDNQERNVIAPAVLPVAKPVTATTARTHISSGSNTIVSPETSAPQQIRTTVSIKDISKDNIKKKDLNEQALEVKEQGPPEYLNSLGENSFTENDLKEKWILFANQIKEKQPRISSALTGSEPRLLEDFKVEFAVNNQLQDNAIKGIKSQLLSFLREQLNNRKIEMTTIFISEPETKNALYTAEDRFNHMAQKNPSLNKLKQQFNLDFE